MVVVLYLVAWAYQYNIGILTKRHGLGILRTVFLVIHLHAALLALTSLASSVTWCHKLGEPSKMAFQYCLY